MTWQLLCQGRRCGGGRGRRGNGQRTDFALRTIAWQLAGLRGTAPSAIARLHYHGGTARTIYRKHHRRSMTERVRASLRLRMMTREGAQIADSIQAYWYLPYSVLVTPLRVEAGKLSGGCTTVTLRNLVSPASSSPAWTAAAPIVESPL